MFNLLEIKKFCSKVGFEPTKRKGQNFLVNNKILEKIIQAADLEPTDTILEIGPGLGILTEVLSQKVKKVVAVELDKKLTEFLKEKFAQQKNIEIIQADILKFKNLKFNFKNCTYKLVANIPYNITGAILRKFLSNKPKPELMVLMIQKEVAQRIIAKNNKNSIISLIVNFYGQPEITGFVSKNNFWPKPKVDSAILKIKLFRKNRLNVNVKKEQNLINLIKTGFANPRKQLINNLKQIEKRQNLEEIFKKIKLDPRIRAEDLSLAKWLEVYYNI